MRTTRITDSDDPRLAEFMALRDGDRRFARPAPAGVREVPAFAVEGLLVVRRALAAGHRPLSMLWDEARMQDAPAVDDSVTVLCAPYDVIRHATGLGVVREVVALFARPPARDPEDAVRHARTAMVLEGVANPVNLGVLVRTAAALGVDATLLDPACTDHLYRRAVRGSMGAVLTHPVARIPPAATAIPWLRARGFMVVALTPADDAVPLDAIPDPGGRPVAIMLGAEGPGLSPDAQRLAEVRARIPMAAGVDSLNVAAAAAVACYAIAQR